MCMYNVLSPPRFMTDPKVIIYNKSYAIDTVMKKRSCRLMRDFCSFIYNSPCLDRWVMQRIFLKIGNFKAVYGIELA
jgi:hypothetical protein